MSKRNIEKIAITGTEHFTERVKAALAEKKPDMQKQIYTYPYVEIKSRNVQEYSGQLKSIEQYDWIMFTSANGISCFFDALDKLNIDLKRLEGTSFAVVGLSTARVLEGYGFKADFCPSAFYAEVLGREFCDLLIKQKKDKTANVLIPRALQGSDKLTKSLDDADISYVDLPVYDTVAVKEVLDKMIADMPLLDCITFASASGVRFLCEKAKLSDISVLCIGKETAKALESFGVRDYEMSKKATAEGLAELILWYSKMPVQ